MSAGDQMGFGPQFVMPGTFHFDGPGHSRGSPTLTGVHPGLFRPPVSPSASSSMHLTKSTVSMLSESTTPVTNAKRKRTKPSSYPARESTPLNDWTLAGENSGVFHSASITTPTTTPAPPVQTSATRFPPRNAGIPSTKTTREEAEAEMDPPGARHYMLAGQLDTPNGGASCHHTDTPIGVLDDSTYSDADYRRELGSKRHCEAMLGDGPTPPLSLTQNSNEPPSNSQASDGWSRFALSALGGVVGKVWEFCKTGAFRGFYAGGGLGYDVNGHASVPRPPPDSDSRDNPDNDIYRDFDTPMDSGVIDPMSMPPSDYNPYTYERQSTPESTPPPAAKRRQVSDNRDELRRNWVLVTEPSSSTKSTTPGSKSRPSNRKRTSGGPYIHHGSPAQSLPSRPLSRASAAPSRTSMGPRYCAPTSSSSGRRISVPVSRLSHNLFSSSASTVGGGGATSHKRTSSRASAAGGLSLQTREPASFASQRSPQPRSTTRHVPRSSTPCRRDQPQPYYPRPSTPSRIPVLNPNPFASNDVRIPSPSASQSSGHRRSHSNASTGSVRGKKKAMPQNIMEQSPRLTEEARHLATKRLAAEREVDARMNAFNRSLQEMIRQGKEALGTTVEVEFDDADADDVVGPGGWVDE